MVKLNRRDDNESTLVAFWTRSGWIWKPMERHAGFEKVVFE